MRHLVAVNVAVNVAIILLAAGRGTRMSSKTPKVYLPVRGVPIVVRSMRRLAEEMRADLGDSLTGVEPSGQRAPGRLPPDGSSLSTDSSPPGARRED